MTIAKIDPNTMTYHIGFRQIFGGWKVYKVHSHELDECGGKPRMALVLPDDSVVSVPLANREYKLFPDYHHEKTRVRLHRDHIAQAASELASGMVKNHELKRAQVAQANIQYQQPQEPRVFDTPARQVSM